MPKTKTKPVLDDEEEETPKNELATLLERLQRGDDTSAVTAITELVSDLRKEAGAGRVSRRDERQRADDLGTQVEDLQAKLDAVLKAMNVGKETSPEDLQRVIAERDAELRKMRVEAEVATTVAASGADPEIVLALLERSHALDDVPDDELKAKVPEVIKTLMKDRPALRGAPPRSGTDAGTGTEAAADQADQTPIELLRKAYAS